MYMKPGRYGHDGIKKMTTEAIQKYPGTIDQLRNDWPGIIEDILEVIAIEKSVAPTKCRNCGFMNSVGSDYCLQCNFEL